MSDLENIYKQLVIDYPKCVITNFSSLIFFNWRDLENSLVVEIYDSTTMDASCEKTGISYKDDVNRILKSLDPTIELKCIPSYIISVLISDLYDSAGFTLDNSQSDSSSKLDKEDNIDDKEKMCWLYSELLKKVRDKEREIFIVSFGEKFKKPISMEQNKISPDFPWKCEKTFDARHINSSRPKGKGLNNLRGTDEIIQKCLEAGSGFEFVMNCIVTSIEKNNYKVIGIYCTAGHHRSVGVVELLKKHIYPNAKIKHLHINR
jgi:hypothetical protein